MCGSGQRQQLDGTAVACAVDAPYSLCADPVRRGTFWIAEFAAIRRFEEDKNRMTVLAGGTEPGFADGVGRSARFHQPASLIVTSDTESLFVTDFYNHAIRRVDIATSTVSTAARDNKTLNSPMQCCWDRTPGVKPDSALYFTLVSDGAIVRFTIASGSVERYSLPALAPFGCACTATGMILFSCIRRMSIFCFDPVAGTVQHMAGGATDQTSWDGEYEWARFRGCGSLTLVDSMGSVFVADRKPGVRCVTLSHELFPLSDG